MVNSDYRTHRHAHVHAHTHTDTDLQTHAETRVRTHTPTTAHTQAQHASYLSGFDFVPSAAGPASEVREHLTLLSIQAGVHLTPPLLQHDRGWRTGDTKERGALSGLTRERKKRACRRERENKAGTGTAIFRESCHLTH